MLPVRRWLLRASRLDKTHQVELLAGYPIEAFRFEESLIERDSIM